MYKPSVQKILLTLLITKQLTYLNTIQIMSNLQRIQCLAMMALLYHCHSHKHAPNNLSYMCTMGTMIKCQTDKEG